jgi:hypothetical protein
MKTNEIWAFLFIKSKELHELFENRKDGDPAWEHALQQCLIEMSDACNSEEVHDERKSNGIHA